MRDLTEQLLDILEKNQDLEPRQIFGEMIQLAATGLYDMAPNYVTAQGVIYQALMNALDDHAEYEGYIKTYDPGERRVYQ